MLPKIISVDDHVLEHPNVWRDRMPERYRDRAPAVRREKGFYVGRGNKVKSQATPWVANEDGDWADVWFYEDLAMPLTLPFAAVGSEKESLDLSVTTYDEIRPGCWIQGDRLADMDVNHTEVSVCFPNFVTRFCGQTFLGRSDQDLALLCVKAYNDWLIDEWCSGDALGRLIPVTLVPLWDVDLAVAEVRRCAEKGSHAVAFAEMPAYLGLESWYSGYWDPLLSACASTNSTLCMHIGSSGSPTTTSDAPLAATSALTFQYGMHSLVDVIFSGALERFPELKIMYSEGNVGWMPYVVERMDMIWKERSADMTQVDLPRLPSSYIAGRIYGCIVDDRVGLANRSSIGMDQICFETDYPHSAGLWPNAAEVAQRLIAECGLTEQEGAQFVRWNAIDAFGLGRHGVSK